MLISGVVNSESSSYETDDATPKNASGLVSDDEHGEQLVRPQENVLREKKAVLHLRLFFKEGIKGHCSREWFERKNRMFNDKK
ncbi:hypothetical protein MTR_2g091035 [Medicago truncatula]|uniref:Uncharacterized protein n=1 Tax=Medicago truncatula TaxID=3880 RepID=G7ZVK4_MEDTR|nr:hypothetical protein MTR_2g091035 [Medicago truncatula]